jgi:hypothetical protein
MPPKEAADSTMEKVDSKLVTNSSSRMIDEANGSAANIRTNVGESDGQSLQNKWHKAVLDCGTLQQLYGETKESQHPFTTTEIGLAGAAAAVVLNQNIAALNGPSAALDGNQGAQSWRNGDVPKDIPAKYNDNISRMLGISPFTSISKGETAPQIRADVVQNLSQTGSAGVDQGLLGDCWFESPLASLASNPKGRQDIADMIERNKDGSYIVSFPGAKKAVTVQQTDLENPSIQNSSSWANILEEAMDKAIPKAAENGLPPQTASYLFTGHLPTTAEFSATRGRGEEQQPDEAQWIQSQLAEGKIITAATDPNNGPVEGNHAYSVLGIISGAFGEPSLVEVRNPWGGQDKGQLTASTDNNQANKPDVGQTIDGVQNLGGGVLLIPSNKMSTYLPQLQSVQP